MNATLKFPVLGFTEIRLIMKGDNKWLAVLIGADLEIEVSENDFFLNKLEKTLKLQTETDLN